MWNAYFRKRVKWLIDADYFFKVKKAFFMKAPHSTLKFICKRETAIICRNCK